MPFGQWHSEAQITAEDVAKGSSIKDLIDTLSMGDFLALLDRNDLEAPLRKVFLRREDDDDDRYKRCGGISSTDTPKSFKETAARRRQWDTSTAHDEHEVSGQIQARRPLGCSGLDC